jgi:hypothetical protein
MTTTTFHNRLTQLVLEELAGAPSGSPEQTKIAAHVMAALAHELGALIGMRAGMADFESADIETVLESATQRIYESAGIGREAGLDVSDPDVRRAILREGAAELLDAALARKPKGGTA